MLTEKERIEVSLEMSKELPFSAEEILNNSINIFNIHLNIYDKNNMKKAVREACYVVNNMNMSLEKASIWIIRILSQRIEINKI